MDSLSISAQFRELSLHLAVMALAFPLILLLAFIARHESLPNFFPL